MVDDTAMNVTFHVGAISVRKGSCDVCLQTWRKGENE